MRRIVVLLLLFACVGLVLPHGGAQPGARTLLTFGFLILAAHTTGALAASVRLPRVVGYLGAGVLFGPSVLDVVTTDSASALAPVSSLAIALIAFLAGAELRWAEVRERGRAISRILCVELSLSFVLLAGLLFATRRWIPFLQGESAVAAIGFCVLFAAVAVVHSPAVTMALLTETRARGPVARTTLGVVLVSDVVVILLFSAALAVARALVPPSGADAAALTLGGVVWELAGAVLVGAVLGAAIAAYLRFVRRELVLFVVLIAFFGVEIARLVHVEALLMLLVAGFVTENVSRPVDGAEIRHAVERSGGPVFTVFFALAGAGLALSDVAAVWPIVLPLVLVRAFAIWAGTAVGARWAGVPRETARHVWMGLVSQAGVAIGLAAVIAEVYPSRGAALRALFLATLAVNQLVGPILFRLALVRSGEVGADVPESAAPETAHAAG